MHNKKYIVIIALLGDPMLPVGIPKTGGFNKTLSEFLDYCSNEDYYIEVITNTNEYKNVAKEKFSERITINRIIFNSNWDSMQDLIYENIDNIYDKTLSLLNSIGIKNIRLVHSFYWVSGIIAEKLKNNFNLHYIHTVISLSEDKLSNGVQANSKYQHNAELNFLKNADKVLAITYQEKETLITKYKIPKEDVIVVGRSINCVYLDKYRNDYIDKYELIKQNENNLHNNDDWWVRGALVYVGRIVEIKGIEQIISSWCYLKEKYALSIPLWLVGGTPMQIQKMRLKLIDKGISISKFEKENSMVWWGNLDSNGIRTLLLKCTALIMHSRFEAGGRVIIEALISGKPVIATNFGFAKDYVYNGYNGFIVEYNDKKSLRDKIMLFEEQPFLSEVLGNNAREYMKLVYNDWDYFKTHKKLYDYYLSSEFEPIITTEKTVATKLNSYKARNKVIAFPYYDTELSEREIAKCLSSVKIDSKCIKHINNNDFHSDIYEISIGIKCIASSIFITF